MRIVMKCRLHLQIERILLSPLGCSIDIAYLNFITQDQRPSADILHGIFTFSGSGFTTLADI